MAIKLYGCSFSGNKVDFSLESGVKVTCLDCGHNEVYKGEMHGEPMCPACSSRSISLETVKQQECKHEYVYEWHSYGSKSGYQCRFCGKLQEVK